jgi:hypothetical protein
LNGADVGDKGDINPLADDDSLEFMPGIATQPFA